MQRISNRKGIVLVRNQRAGIIEETEVGFRFTYDSAYLATSDAIPVSLTLPLQVEPFESPHLFSYFEGILAEGSLKELQCRTLRIDPKDNFGRLLRTTDGDVIGCVNLTPLLD
jgi:serine/threonine-protein kinase HipA